MITRAISAGTLLAALLLLGGCAQDMARQPRYGPLAASDFFPDGRSARPLVEGTVARGLLRTDTPFFTGRSGKTLVAEIPVPVDRKLLERGQNRYNIYCVPCHDPTGSGNGMIPQRGLRHPPSYHIDRLRNAPAGHFFDVITRGLGLMPDYADRLTPQDRWAVVAYVRVLQMSQNAKIEDVPPAERSKLDKAGEIGRASCRERV